MYATSSGVKPNFIPFSEPLGSSDNIVTGYASAGLINI